MHGAALMVLGGPGLIVQLPDGSQTTASALVCGDCGLTELTAHIYRH
jgi:hypothetical protein